MIEAKNLVKQYGSNEALHGVSFTFEDGRIYGFLGPNGAGKSTTMNIITGCLAPTSGEVKINGFDIFDDAKEAKRCIGYLPEQPPLYLDMTAEEYLYYVGGMKGIKGEELILSVAECIEKTNIGSVKDRLMKHLSKGYKQRVGIAQALLGNPPIIILDEPTVGLDPKQIIEIRQLILSLKESHTVILSSHILTEINEVCDYAVIISDGNIVASDTIENLTTVWEGAVNVEFEARCSENKAYEILSSLSDIKRYTVRKKGAGLVETVIECSKDIDPRDDVFFLFADAKVPIISMKREETSLEKVFLGLTSKSNNDKFSESSNDTDDYEPIFGEISPEE